MKDEQLNVFRLLQESLQQFRLENIIIGVEFNLYLDPRLDKLDTMPDSHDNPEYRQDILSFLDTENLIDRSRVQNPYAHVFTWFRGKARSRLDFFFFFYF